MSMPRSAAASSAPDDVPAQTWAEDKNPTRPLPKFRLEEEARRLDQALTNEDRTVTVSAEQNRRLLASVFAEAGAMRSPISDSPLDAPANADDEPTLDAPAPAAGSITEAIVARLSLGPQLVRTAPAAPATPSRPPALKMLVITRPMPVATLALGATMAAPPTPSAKPAIDTYVVAGIWATAAFLIGLLMFIAT
jgi:hypothetical protein